MEWGKVDRQDKTIIWDEMKMQDKLFGIDDDEGSSNFCQFLDVFKMVL